MGLPPKLKYGREKFVAGTVVPKILIFWAEGEDDKL